MNVPTLIYLDSVLDERQVAVSENLQALRDAYTHCLHLKYDQLDYRTFDPEEHRRREDAAGEKMLAAAADFLDSLHFLEKHEQRWRSAVASDSESQPVWKNFEPEDIGGPRPMQRGIYCQGCVDERRKSVSRYYFCFSCNQEPTRTPGTCFKCGAPQDRQQFLNCFDCWQKQRPANPQNGAAAVGAAEARDAKARDELRAQAERDGGLFRTLFRHW